MECCSMQASVSSSPHLLAQFLNLTDGVGSSTTSWTNMHMQVKNFSFSVSSSSSSGVEGCDPARRLSVWEVSLKQGERP